MSTINPQECEGGGQLQPISCSDPSVPIPGGLQQHQQPTPPTTQGLPLGGIVVLGNVPGGGSPFGAPFFVPTVPGESDPGGGGGGVFVPHDPGTPPVGTVGPGSGTPIDPSGTIGTSSGTPTPPTGTLGPISGAGKNYSDFSFGFGYTPGTAFGPGMGNY